MKPFCGLPVTPTCEPPDITRITLLDVLGPERRFRAPSTTQALEMTSPEGGGSLPPSERYWLDAQPVVPW